jgi:hypothetical protein
MHASKEEQLSMQPDTIFKKKKKLRKCNFKILKLGAIFHYRNDELNASKTSAKPKSEKKL